MYSVFGQFILASWYQLYFCSLGVAMAQGASIMRIPVLWNPFIKLVVEPSIYL